MFYFFHKGPDYLRCELRADDTGQGYDLAITEPGGQERVEHFDTSEAAHRRWAELQKQLVADGWFGPSGRE
jgi:hypothetical protein